MVDNVKNSEEKIVFLDAEGAYQTFPNHIMESDKNRPFVVVGAGFDLEGKKIENGQLVDKTEADLEAETQAENTALSDKYRAMRSAALSSPELTIYHDSTLSQAEKDEINAVRQAWYDMTNQANYPASFVRPALNEQ